MGELKVRVNKCREACEWNSPPKLGGVAAPTKKVAKLPWPGADGHERSECEPDRAKQGSMSGANVSPIGRNKEAWEIFDISPRVGFLDKRPHLREHSQLFHQFVESWPADCQFNSRAG